MTQPPHDLDMKCEDQRLLTFRNWPYTSNAASCMAEEGFYRAENASRENDEAICFSCKHKSSGWQGLSNHGVFLKHKKDNPQCDRYTNPSEFYNTNISLPNSEGPYREETSLTADEMTRGNLYEFLTQLLQAGSQGLLYRKELHRLATFVSPGCSAELKRYAAELAKDGFFFVGDNIVRTFCCGLTLKFEPPNVEFGEHHKLSQPDCDFFQDQTCHAGNKPWDNNRANLPMQEIETLRGKSLGPEQS